MPSNILNYHRHMLYTSAPHKYRCPCSFCTLSLIIHTPCDTLTSTTTTYYLHCSMRAQQALRPHLEHIYRKLEVTNRVEAVTEGLRKGLIQV